MIDGRDNLPPGCSPADIDALCPPECSDCEQPIDDCECEEIVDAPDPEASPRASVNLHAPSRRTQWFFIY